MNTKRKRIVYSVSLTTEVSFSHHFPRFGRRIETQQQHRATLHHNKGKEKDAKHRMDLLTKAGVSKVVERCTYPLTALGCVKRIYSDMATLACTPRGLQLIDLVDGLTSEDLSILIGLPIAQPTLPCSQVKSG